MRGKRSKQYRKLMEQFSLTFGFREPYQIIVDAEMVQDATRFKMDLAAGLQRTVHGKVKPMITQCEIRKLYARKDQPGGNDAIELAKEFERRRCGHHPDEYPEPLETIECIKSIVDPKSTGQNKNRYVVASQSLDVRRMLRGIKGVPLIYIKRSVMILEPMADESAEVRQREERDKFRAELKKNYGKRKREQKDEGEEGGEVEKKQTGSEESSAAAKKPKKPKGAKGVNPLSAMKRKKTTKEGPKKKITPKEADVVSDAPAKRKRRKKVNSENGPAAATAGDDDS
ncbi:rRNA-processing protein utp23 [Cladobotryum mycophilum]|uniref:rRNA-processing protein utp23 n=1 Tax=Cladobotryum mycophilum TaxID=491253 RepID=A0ABR0SEI5_9HYPO